MALTKKTAKPAQGMQLDLDLRGAGGMTAAEVAQLGPQRKPNPYKAHLLRMRAMREGASA